MKKSTQLYHLIDLCGWNHKFSQPTHVSQFASLVCKNAFLVQKTAVQPPEIYIFELRIPKAISSVEQYAKPFYKANFIQFFHHDLLRLPIRVQ